MNKRQILLTTDENFGAGCGIEETDKFVIPMSLHALAHASRAEHGARREQRGGVVALCSPVMVPRRPSVH
jgi:hypothetical protein